MTSVSISTNMFYMRTTLEVPEDLLNEAQRLLQFKSKTDTVISSLRELIRRKRIEELKEMAGSIRLDVDLNRSRRRPRKECR
jgi:Arc/MetJ family transcription regulator